MISLLGGSAYTLATAPLLPWWAIAALAAAGLVMLALGLWRRARGIFWRSAALAMLLLILVNPSLVEEKRSPLRRGAGAELRPGRQGHAADRAGRGFAGAADAVRVRAGAAGARHLAQGWWPAASTDHAGRARHQAGGADRSWRSQRARTRGR